MIDYKALAERIAYRAVFAENNADPKNKEWASDLRTLVSLLTGMAEERPVAWMRPDNRVREESFTGKQFSRGEQRPPIGTWVPLYLRPTPQPQPCTDPACPCQDGDPCHYVDHGKTKAMPQPQPEPRPCTCHPDDNPPVPCARQYALNECRAASEPTEAQIEAAAQRMCQLKADRLSLDFDYLWQQAKDGLIEEAREVLRAALAAKEQPK